jgi:hypothetical protein
MKENISEKVKDNYLNMTRKDRIKYTMEIDDVKFPGVKFDLNGNINKRRDVEVEPYDSELIFENENFLKYIIILLRKYLEERLIGKEGDYTCYGNSNLEDRWMVTEQFCEEMGIDYGLIQLLVEYLDYPTCEGDFLNDYSVEDILEAFRNFKEDDDVEQEKTNTTN